MRSSVLMVLLFASTAHADEIDAKAIAKQLEGCASPEALASVGAIQSAETIGKRPAKTIIQVVGKKARGYVVFEDGNCYITPIAGKPIAFAKGNFGGGAVVAYALRGAHCTEVCATVVSLKTKDDKLVDVLPLPMDCEDNVTMAKRAVFAGRDSLELGCFTSGGADQSRTDFILDAGDGTLQSVLQSASGTAWVQIDEKRPGCVARVPGGLKVTTGSKPAIDVTTMSTPEAAEAAKVEWHSGGCEATVATRRFAFDGKQFVPTGKPRISIAKKLCRCPKR